MGNLCSSCRKRGEGTQSDENTPLGAHSGANGARITSLEDLARSPGPRRQRFLEAVRTPPPPEPWPTSRSPFRAGAESSSATDNKAKQDIEDIDVSEVERWMKEQVEHITKEVEARRSTPPRNRTRSRLNAEGKQGGLFQSWFANLFGSGSDSTTAVTAGAAEKEKEKTSTTSSTTTTENGTETETVVETTHITTLGGDGSTVTEYVKESTTTTKKRSTSKKSNKKGSADADQEEEEQVKKSKVQSVADEEEEEVEELPPTYTTPLKRRTSRAARG